MANRPVEAEARERIQSYLASATTLPSKVAPITRGALARATGFHWKTVAKYLSDDELAEAVRRQERLTKVAKDAGRELLEQAKAEASDWRKKYETVVAQIVLIEGNARRLGLDPADLYRVLQVPSRMKPHQPKRGR